MSQEISYMIIQSHLKVNFFFLFAWTVPAVAADDHCGWAGQCQHASDCGDYCLNYDPDRSGWTANCTIDSSTHLGTCCCYPPKPFVSCDCGGSECNQDSDCEQYCIILCDPDKSGWSHRCVNKVPGRPGTCCCEPPTRPSTLPLHHWSLATISFSFFKCSITKHLIVV